jgi:hypothetical protein
MLSAIHDETIIFMNSAGNAMFSCSDLPSVITDPKRGASFPQTIFRSLPALLFNHHAPQLGMAGVEKRRQTPPHPIRPHQEMHMSPPSLRITIPRPVRNHDRTHAEGGDPKIQ